MVRWMVGMIVGDKVHSRRATTLDLNLGKAEPDKVIEYVVHTCMCARMFHTEISQLLRKSAYSL